MSAPLEKLDHRPWPLPSEPWVIWQSWRHLLFAHWPVPAQQLAPTLPGGLALEQRDGSAWLGVVAFGLYIRPRGVPPIPRISWFPEINVRTYVTHQGRPGVWFYSLDARSVVAVKLARSLFSLPYYRARMRLRVDDGRVTFESSRAGAGDTARFRAEYAPTSDPFEASPGSLDHWLTERYCLYTVDRAGRLCSADVHHAPWPLQRAEARIDTQTMLEPLGVQATGEPLLHFSRRLDVTTWRLRPVGAR